MKEMLKFCVDLYDRVPVATVFLLAYFVTLGLILVALARVFLVLLGKISEII